MIATLSAVGLYVVQSGPAEGLPVVFLHGAAASGARMWRRQLSELSKDLRCLAVDLPGHGGSSTVPWESMDGAAEQVAEVIKTEAGGHAAVVGMSLGGYVALQLAMLDQKLISSAIVSGVSILPVPFGSRVWQRGQIIARYSAFGSAVSGSHRAPGAAAENVDDFVARPVSRQISTKIADEIVQFRLSDRPKRVDAAVLAVAGARESKPVLESLSLIASRFAAGRARYVPDAGHHWYAEHSDLFDATVRSWVTEQRLPPKLRDPEGWMR